MLRHCVKRFEERFDELAESLCIEAGKPIKDSKGEVTRLIDTFQIACDESVKAHGEMLNLEIGERTKGYRGWTKRVPIGPCSFISPFNFPLNLAAHKIAPAIAAGCPFVLKPASKTPIGALLIGEILAETDLPEGAFSILPCSRDGADLFTTDERLKFLSFTGSPDVGWKLKEKAGKKKVILELGGNAACVIDDVLLHLMENCPNYNQHKPILTKIADYIAEKRDGLTSTKTFKPDKEAANARVLAEAIRNQRL